MKNILLSIFSICILFTSTLAQKKESPKLIVGIIIDQMRWDYLYKFNSLFNANGGFKRLLDKGFSCENTFIPYTPTITAVGHSSTYTGSVPNIHGIVGNTWYDKQQRRMVYCTEDKSVSTVGSATNAGQMSPRNMFANTIGDELRIATNFKSKVIGVAIKDRGAILSAGHAASGAYWYDSKTGDFVTSTWYMNELPAWVQQFNSRKLPDSLYRLNWKLYLNKEVYAKYCSEDVKEYETRPFGKDQLEFPYDLSKFAGKDYGKISSTPYGNTLTVAMAQAAILGEKLGKGEQADFLAVSFSSPDYIGHSFGPDSWEQLDDYIRLDNELGHFFEFLDATVGQGQYTLFLTADHGVAHIPGFLKENRMPGGNFIENKKNLNAVLKQKFGVTNSIAAIDNYQIYLNHFVLDSAKMDKGVIIQWFTLIRNFLKVRHKIG